MSASSNKEFIFPCRVYWEDTDGGGVVYYANYLKFMERARTEWLRALGIEQTSLREQYGVLLVVARVAANFKRSARLDDLLQVSCKVIEQRQASISFEQTVCRTPVNQDTGGNELLLDGLTRVGCIDASTFKPRAMPDVIAQAIEKYQQA